MTRSMLVVTRASLLLGTTLIFSYPASAFHLGHPHGSSFEHGEHHERGNHRWQQYQDIEPGGFATGRHGFGFVPQRHHERCREIVMYGHHGERIRTVCE